MELKVIAFGIYFLTALTISPSYGRPEKSDAEGAIDLLEFQVHEDPNEIPKEIEQIISEDWADTWEASQEMKEWFPYYITGKTEDGATGERMYLLHEGTLLQSSYGWYGLTNFGGIFQFL